MASRVHLPDDHNHTTECFKRQSDAGFGINDTVSIAPPSWPSWSDAGAAEWGFVGVSEPSQPHTRLDWWAVGHRAVEYVCVAVLGGMAALRVWGASC